VTSISYKDINAMIRSISAMRLKDAVEVDIDVAAARLGAKRCGAASMQSEFVTKRSK
jgi:hypothetical protein